MGLLFVNHPNKFDDFDPQPLSMNEKQYWPFNNPSKLEVPFLFKEQTYCRSKDVFPAGCHVAFPRRASSQVINSRFASCCEPLRHDGNRRASKGTNPMPPPQYLGGGEKHVFLSFHLLGNDPI